MGGAGHRLGSGGAGKLGHGSGKNFLHHQVLKRQGFSQCYLTVQFIIGRIDEVIGTKGEVVILTGQSVQTSRASGTSISDFLPLGKPVISV